MARSGNALTGALVNALAGALVNALAGALVATRLAVRHRGTSSGTVVGQ